MRELTAKYKEDIMSDKIFSVIDYGAKPNSKEIQTDAVQKALDACFLSGGGEVILPTGTYIIGDVRVRSNTTLHLMENACLMGSLDAADYDHINSDTLEPLPTESNPQIERFYPHEWKGLEYDPIKQINAVGNHWNHGIIRAAYAENISIIGERGSCIDGGNVYDPCGEEKYRGPHAINMHFCKNLTFKGYSVKNSSNWAHAIYETENLKFENVSVYGGHDGIHPTACDNVIISDCTLITGDDGVAGFDNLDVVVRNCEISSACSAFRFGGNNILVENCNVYGPSAYQFRGSFTPEEKEAGLPTSAVARNNMLSFWTNWVDDRLPVRRPTGKIRVRNCTVNNADRFLHLNLSGNEPWQKGVPPTDIAFENIKAENTKLGITAYGKEGCPLSLTFKNMEYSHREGSEDLPVIRTAFCDEINLDGFKVKNYKGQSLIRTWSEGIKFNISNLECDLGDGELIAFADEEFICKPI